MNKPIDHPDIILDDMESHLNEVYRLLTGTVCRQSASGKMEDVDGICTLVWDLERIDAAIGERGKSVFAAMAQTIQQVYVEICAAREVSKQLWGSLEALAAHQCIFYDGSGLTGDEYGNQICLRDEKLKKLEGAMVGVRKPIKRAEA